MLHERHECGTSEKTLILITTRVKTYFHIPIFTIWQVKDYKERNNFILSTTFGNASFPCQNAFEKCTTKTELFNSKRYIKNFYTCLELYVDALVRSLTVTHSNAVSFSIKTILYENTNILFSKNY